MDWFTIGWQDPRPTQDQVAEEVERLRFLPVEVERPRAASLVSAMAEVNTNGGAVFGTFAIEGTTDVSAWFLSRNRLGELPLGRALLGSPSVQAVMGVTGAPELVGSVDLGWSDSLLLEGEIAHRLVFGGAHEEFTGTKAEARSLARGFCDDVMADRLDDVRVQRAPGAVWSRWHRSPTWSSTWVMVDRRFHHVSLLSVTDQD